MGRWGIGYGQGRGKANSAAAGWKEAEGYEADEVRGRDSPCLMKTNRKKGLLSVRTVSPCMPDWTPTSSI